MPTSDRRGIFEVRIQAGMKLLHLLSHERPASSSQSVLQRYFDYVFIAPTIQDNNQAQIKSEILSTLSSNPTRLAARSLAALATIL